MANLKSYEGKNSDPALSDADVIPLAGVQRGVTIGELIKRAAPVVETPTGADVALDVVGGREYLCGTLTSLRLMSVAASPRLSIVRFSSGAAPTEFTYPDSLPITGWTMPQAETTYDLFIWQGAATIVYR